MIKMTLKSTVSRDALLIGMKAWAYKIKPRTRTGDLYEQWNLDAAPSLSPSS